MENSDQPIQKEKIKMTPKTRRIMVGFLGVIGIGAIGGSAFGSLETSDAMVIVVAIITGFFSLLKGER